MESVRAQMSSMGYFQQNPNVQPSTHLSTKGSCDQAGMSTEAQEDDIIEDQEDMHELYVDDHCSRLVALRKVYNLGKTLHHKTLEHDMVRVTVKRVVDASAHVPVPIEDVEIVVQAPGHFIQWPRRLVKPLSRKDIDKVGPSKRSEHRRHGKSDSPKDIDKDDLPSSWILRLVLVAQELGTKDLPMPLEHDGSKDVMLFLVTSKELMDLCTPGQEVWVSQLQLWCTYLYRLSIQKGTIELYGYLDPSLIMKTFSNAASVKAYIQKTLNASKRVCYLALYLEDRHWQLLILCPRQCVVVFLCSLHKVPDAAFKDIIDTLISKVAVGSVDFM